VEERRPRRVGARRKGGGESREPRLLKGRELEGTGGNGRDDAGGASGFR